MSRLQNLSAGLVALLLLAAGLARAETVLWSDNFDTAGRSWITNSIWKIGSPTYGPASAHSGAKCAGTGLTAAVPANADSRLICTNYNGTNWLLLPDASQSPRLRFWEWFKFVNSEGWIEIHTSSNASWQVISHTNIGAGGTANYSGVWSGRSVDLTAYAGQKVQIAFHFLSGPAGWGADPGWYVDDVAVVAGPPIFNNPEGFESGLGDWWVDAGTWEAGRPTSGPGAAHAGTNCAGTVLAGDYGWNLSSRLISPPFTVPTTSKPLLRYSEWYRFVNAGGVVEINNGSISYTAITNIVITTNTVAVLDTNIYQMSGTLLPQEYFTPFFWNATIGAWTNATKVMGNVWDISRAGYFFETGSAPFARLNLFQPDYIALTNPIPQSPAPTNFSAWQGMTWSNLFSSNPNDRPIGYFGTNYVPTYTTNTYVIVAANDWVPISTTNKGVGGSVLASVGWTNAAVDLSAYAGQKVRVGFHFFSGPAGWGNAPGWYVDDINLALTPSLTVPTNLFISYGQTLTNQFGASNSIMPGAVFTFGFAKASTNAVVTSTNGLFFWTNTVAPPGTYTVSAKVTDNQSPPLAVTNNFTVTVRPLPSQLVFTNALMLNRTNPAFKLTVKPRWTNVIWMIEATTNLGAGTNWIPIYTNKLGVAGSISITDRLATNFGQRYYRAVFP